MEQGSSGKIFTAVLAVLRDMPAIGKDRKNQMQNYNFRGIDDVYDAVHPLFAKHGVFSAPSVVEHSVAQQTVGKANTLQQHAIVKMAYTFYADDGSAVRCEAVGEAMDTGDKATNKAMAAAHKYALMQLFAIALNEPIDTENHDPTKNKPAAPYVPASPPAPQPAPQQPPPAPNTGEPSYEDARTALYERANKWLRHPAINSPMSTGAFISEVAHVWLNREPSTLADLALIESKMIAKLHDPKTGKLVAPTN